MICRICKKQFINFTWFKNDLCKACWLFVEEGERAEQEKLHLEFNIDGIPLDESYSRELVASEVAQC